MFCYGWLVEILADISEDIVYLNKNGHIVYCVIIDFLLIFRHNCFVLGGIICHSTHNKASNFSQFNKITQTYKDNTYRSWVEAM